MAAMVPNVLELEPLVSLADLPCLSRLALRGWMPKSKSSQNFYCRCFQCFDCQDPQRCRRLCCFRNCCCYCCPGCRCFLQHCHHLCRPLNCHYRSPRRCHYLGCLLRHFRRCHCPERRQSFHCHSRRCSRCLGCPLRYFLHRRHFRFRDRR